MSLEEKKSILIEYFRNHDGYPRGTVSYDSGIATVGNVMINGTWIGVFDYIAKEFIQLAD